MRDGWVSKAQWLFWPHVRTGKRKNLDFFDEAVLDVDGGLVATGAGCKQSVESSRPTTAATRGASDRATEGGAHARRAAVEYLLK